jgi:hypothetical protein
LVIAALPIAGWGDQLPLTITTNPSPPLPNEPFDISVTGLIDRYRFGDPTVDESGGIVTVSLHRTCNQGLSNTCDPPTDDAVTVRSAPLPPGNYTIIAYQFVPSGGVIEGLLSFAIAPALPSVYRGLWWASPAGSQSGWGLSIEQQGDTLFAVWFTYDTNSPATAQGLHSGMWLVMPNGVKTGNAAYSGDLYRTVGEGFPTSPYLMRASLAGHGTVSFGDDDNGVFVYTVNDVPAAGLRTVGSTLITRQIFSAPVPRCTPGT